MEIMDNLKDFTTQFLIIKNLESLVAASVSVFDRNNNFIANGVMDMGNKRRCLELPIRLNKECYDNITVKTESGYTLKADLEIDGYHMSVKEDEVIAKTFCSFAYLKNADFSPEYISKFSCFIPVEFSQLHTFRFQLETIHYFWAETIYNYQCVRIYTGEFQFDILQVKKGEKGYYVIDCLNEISFQTFGDYCFSIQQAIGFIMGYMPGGEIFYFSDKGTFYYTDRIRPAMQSMYYPIYTNPYQFKQLLGTESVYFRTKLNVMSSKDFSKLISWIYKDKRFSSVLMMMIESESVCSLLLGPSIFAIVLESLTNIMTFPFMEEKRPIQNRELFKKISVEIEKIIDTYSSEIESEDDILKLKRRIPDLNKVIRQNHLTNNEKLIQPFDLLGIKLTADDIHMIEHRNDLLHGNTHMTDDENMEDVEINRYMMYASGKFYTLISSLILKYIGYDGYIINHAKVCEQQSGIETEEKLYKLI